MKRLINARLAGNLLLFFLALTVVLHFFVLFGVVPATIVWGGQAGDNIAVLEIIALVMTGLFMVITAARVGYVNAGRFVPVVRIGMWVMCAFFALNTVGNLNSAVSIETLIFAPITIILILLTVRVAIE